MDFLALSQQCGLDVNPVTTMAIIKSESGFDPLVIRDNTTHRTIHFTTKDKAVAAVKELDGKHHKLAVGLMQITSPWFAKYSIKPEVLFDACSNIQYGTKILSDNYRAYYAVSHSKYKALQQAISTYWSGNPHTGGAYVNYVYSKAGSPVRMEETPGISDGILMSDSRNDGISFPASYAEQK